MASLKLEHIYKVYPNGTKAVNDFTMNIDDQEFIVFVGPSGCGKSTTLRMIAGLEEISAGELYIGDQIVNDVEPKDRDIAMVFQNYALYPHMTVYENMAFGLTLRHVPRNIIHEKVLWAAEILGLKEYLDRKPKAMSGGQRQRVSLGRAILRNPKVMLLDEPLSNLDAKLRSQMRSEISKLHQSLKTTFIYVTHDQVEAMTLGTRVVVMKLGRIQQIDTPKNLYDYPENKFVAGFIGTPQMNFFDVTLKREKDKVAIAFVDEDVDNQVIHIPFSEMLKVHKYYMNGDRVVTMGVRCEDLSIEPEDVKDGKNLIDMRITHFEELGNETLVYGDLSMKEKGIMDSPTKIIVKASSKLGHKSGDIVKVHVNVLKAHFFDHQTELSISSRLPKTNIFAINVDKGKIHILGHDITLPAAIKEALPETYKGSIDLPVRSVKVGEGELEATISRLERINDLTLAYLVIGEHTFFALVDDKQKVGDKVKVFLDFKDASFSNLDGEALAPLKERDELIANFINFRTAIANVNEGMKKGEYNETAKKFIAERDHRVELVTKQYDEKIAALDEKYAKELEEAKTINVDEVRAKNKERLDSETIRIKGELAKSIETAKKELNELKAKHKETVAKIEKEVADNYAKRVQNEKEDYARARQINKDRDSLLARKAAHDLFKETAPKDRDNELKDRLNAEALEFESAKGAITSEIGRQKAQAKADLKELKETIERENNPVAYLEKVYNKEHAKLVNERSEKAKLAGLIFFFKVGDVYTLLPEDISNKVIQGLGSRVFTRTYRIELAHDAYTILDNPTLDSLKVTVTGIKDYGRERFIAATLDNYGVEYELLILSDKKVNVGDTLNVAIDIEKSQIYETSMNLRLF